MTHANSEINQRLFRDCNNDETFWVFQGETIPNIYGLVEAIGKMTLYTFRYHVNKDNNKNDFADWIRMVLGDRILAARLEGVMEKRRYLKIILNRIDEVKSSK